MCKSHWRVSTYGNVWGRIVPVNTFTQNSVARSPSKFTALYGPCEQINSSLHLRRNSFHSYEDLKIPDMHFTSQNTPHITLGNDQCLKFLPGVCNTKKRGDLSLSLLETYWDGRGGGWYRSRPRRRRCSRWRWSGSSGCSLPSGFELNKKKNASHCKLFWELQNPGE